MLIGKHMLKGPKGQKRPADVVANAVRLMEIATGEIEEKIIDDGKNKAAVELGSRGGRARAEKLSTSERIAIAKRGASVRWKLKSKHAR